MEHISPQSIMTRSTMSPDPMYAMDDFLCPPTGSLSVTKPVKKRKSWGQELPEPKTALPPRKRAKTEDEKEQRRIERIKRNRAAAHNSRERKRVEAEQLANANEGLHKQLQYLRQRVAHQEAQLAKCKEQLGGTLPEVSIEEPVHYTHRSSTSERRSVSISPSAASTFDPRHSLSTVTPLTSPDNTPFIKLEDAMPGTTANDEPLFDSLDLTQHSAAMLCDLQCRSSELAINQRSPQSILQTWLWTRIIIFMMQLSISNLYQTTLMALWTHFPARMNHLLATSARGSTLTAPLQPSTIRSKTPPTHCLTLAQHFLLATGHSTLGSSAFALSGVWDVNMSPAAWSSRRFTDKGLLDRSFEDRGSEVGKDNNKFDVLQGGGPPNGQDGGDEKEKTMAE